MRVLIVDDDDISLELLETALTGAGYEIELARDGFEALERLRSGEFRLVISDWEMPRLNGVELCKKVRERQFAQYVYFILVTAREGANSVVEGLEAGADDFISKPFDPAELRVRLRAGQRVLSLRSRNVTIFALAKLAESRDPETGAHLDRIREYCRVIARRLAEMDKFRDVIDGEYVETLYLTSPLHDIGKVGIPDGVLLKPSRLTDREFEIMKAHTSIGARALDAALHQDPDAHFLRMARDIALSHHERFDGNGYPQGLAGEEIPLCARIVALADVYDALTSRRVYKDAFSHEVARSIIIENRGTDFDPDIVDAFLSKEDVFIAVMEHLNESRATEEEPAARVLVPA